MCHHKCAKMLPEILRDNQPVADAWISRWRTYEIFPGLLFALFHKKPSVVWFHIVLVAPLVRHIMFYGMASFAFRCFYCIFILLCCIHHKIERCLNNVVQLFAKCLFPLKIIIAFSLRRRRLQRRSRWFTTNSLNNCWAKMHWTMVTLMEKIDQKLTKGK